MDTLTVKLKQHTPLIHFQHEQCGATLRASEVKPQLDRFLLHRLGREGKVGGCSVDEALESGKSKAKTKKWLVGSGEHPSLNYKMRIVPNSEPDIEPIERVTVNRNGNRRNEKFPCFFANMGDGTEQKQFSYVRNGLTMTLFFPSIKVKEKEPAIENGPALSEWLGEGDKLAEFFFRYNFGTRGSKGFGSFYIDENDDQYVPPEDIYRKLKSYRFFVNSTDKKILFGDIELFYKFMREGINFTNNFIPVSRRLYCKPLIWWYCKDVLGRGWEKEAIKKDLLRLSNYSDGAPNACYDVRDLLGLSSSESWRSYSKTIVKEVKDIDRMASPILFKPILEGGRFVVYMNANTGIKAVGLKGLKDAKHIKISVQNRSREYDIPQNFSIAGFLKYFFEGNQYPFNALVKDEYIGGDLYDRLKKIYNTIKTERAKLLG